MDSRHHEAASFASSDRASSPPPQAGLPLRSRLPGVGTTIFSVMSALAAETGAVNLGQGFPDSTWTTW